MTAIRRSLSTVAAIVAAATLLLLSTAQAASAHAGNQSYLYLDLSGQSVSGRIEMPHNDLETALGIEIGDDLAPVAETIEQYAEDHIAIGDGSTSWPIEATSTEYFYSDLPEQDDNYVVVQFAADTGGADVPRQLTVTLDPFFDEVDGRDALLLIGNDWDGGVIENGHEVTATFNAGSSTQTIDLGDTGWWKTTAASMKLGINHIRTGPDHILFVLVLLLPSVLVWRGGWEPASSFGVALWRVLKIVTMFTVAHTITFTLAGLDILPLPSPRITESVIAVSIAAAALYNLQPVAHGKEWLLAFVFGLFHGLGFAGLVEGLDVSQSTKLLSLLGRNLGIEIGQAVVVTAFFPALFLLRRTRFYLPFMKAASILLAAVSIGWLIERAFEVELGVSSVVEPVFDFPAIIVLLAALTAASAGAFFFSRSRDQLIEL